MIGCYEDACDAVEGFLSYLSDNGSARSVFIDFEGKVVYKVDKEYGVNAHEYKILKALSQVTLPPHIRIPAFNAFDVDGQCVIAMEYIDGVSMGECFCDFAGLKCECDSTSILSESVANEIIELGVTDFADGNVILKDGIYYLIDVEC